MSDPKRILRAEVPVDDRWHIFELRGPIVHVAARKVGAVDFWWLDDPDAPPASRGFRVVGTGQPIPTEHPIYVGAAIVADGALVWHLIQHDPVVGGESR